MRILYCMNSLGGRGGIERVTIVKANALAEIPGNEVAICFTDKGNFPVTIHPLSPKVKVYFLDTPYWDLHTFGIWQLFHFPRKVLQTREAIKNVIQEFRPNVLINTGSYEKFACALIRSKNKFAPNGRLKKIREFHFASNYREFLANGRLGKITSKLITFFDKYILSLFFDCSYLLTQTDLLENCRVLKHIGKADMQYNPQSFNELPPPIRRRPSRCRGVRLFWRLDGFAFKKILRT